jgi:hypothetical protein
MIPSKKIGKYSIYEWIEDLKLIEWGRPRNRNGKPIGNSTDEIEMWCEHFIGEGYYAKISSLVDRMLNALEKVDTVDINWRMYDVYDQIPSYKEKYTTCAIAYVIMINTTNR